MDEYEELTLEVLLDGYPVVRVNQENGVENLVAELGGSEPGGSMARKVRLGELIQALIKIDQLMHTPKPRAEIDDG
ncbi:hypothetical protein [Paraburkholderia sp.]|uniref:hypothetical protein n=1 Tax=Paraburkholderia sp. TaxID=1926495 RepID=UPI002D3C5E65|nr:hypothetical protein [Paraburkholderia sp.]HZZ04841.1 hypothetical protein [Paraburkholderia sp.]